MIFTFPSLLNLLGPFYRSESSLFSLQLSPTPVEVLHHDSNEHVEHEESNKQEEGNKVEKSPFIEILDWLENVKIKHFYLGLGFLQNQT